MVCGPLARRRLDLDRYGNRDPLADPALSTMPDRTRPCLAITYCRQCGWPSDREAVDFGDTATFVGKPGLSPIPFI